MMCIMQYVSLVVSITAIKTMNLFQSEVVTTWRLNALQDIVQYDMINLTRPFNNRHTEM